MTHDLSIRNIALTKINNIVNPNYINKFILLTFFLGSAMVSKNIILEILLSFELMTQSFYFKAQLSGSSNNLLFYFGCFFVVISLYFFYEAHISKGIKFEKSYRNLKSASEIFRKLLDENERIFKECGPNSSSFNQGEVRQDFSVWEQAKSEIILPNNNKLYGLLNNIKKLTQDEAKLVNKMKSHIEHFKAHIINPGVDYTEHQFPLDFSELIYGFSTPSRKQKEKIKNTSEWLVTKIKNYNVESIYMFGSFLYSDNSNDVDLIIKTKDFSLDEIRSNAKRWKEIEDNYYSVFNIHLHLSVFSELEKKSYVSFLSKLRNCLRVL